MASAQGRAELITWKPRAVSALIATWLRVCNEDFFASRRELPRSPEITQMSSWFWRRENFFAAQAANS